MNAPSAVVVVAAEPRESSKKFMAEDPVGVYVDAVIAAVPEKPMPNIVGSALMV